MIPKNKKEKIFEFLEKEKLDAILLTNFYFCKDANLAYFSNFYGEGYLILSKNFCALFANPLEIKNIKRFSGEIFEMKKQNLQNFLKEKKIKRIGINTERIPFNFVKILVKKLKIKIFDISKFLSELRSVKTRKEIKLIKNSCKIANFVIKKVENFVHSGILEKCLQDLIIYEIRKKADIAFKPIIAFEKRSSIPHPIPRATNKKLNKIGYADFGVRYKNYNCDVTLMFLKEENRVVNSVLESFKIIEKNLKPGFEVREIAKEVENFLKKEKLELLHPLGHGIGFEVHELPTIAKNSKDILKNNMVVAIEPAVYLKSFGVRIENDYLISKKPKKLTFSKIIWI